MASQYFPYGDLEFEAFLAVLLANLPAVMTALSLPATFDDALVAAKAAYSTDLAAHLAEQTAAQNAREVKQTSKETAIEALRNVVNMLRANPAFTDSHATALGLPIYDTTPTPTAPTSETPSLAVDNSASQTHIISFWQMSETDEGTFLQVPRPKWARALRIVRSVVESGEPCPAIELMGWLASDTASPYMVTYNGTAVGKDAYYRGAWETQSGEIGLWSDAVKATITG